MGAHLTLADLSAETTGRGYLEVRAEWPAYGYCRVTTELHGEGGIVNHKNATDEGNRPCRRFIATTDSDRDGPI